MTNARSPSLFRHSAAFTLVELIIALAIASLLLAMAGTAFHDWLASAQLANHAKHIAESMTRARTEAIRRGHRVNLCKSSDRRQCASRGGWESGFIVYADVNHDGQISNDESVLGVEGSAPPGITVEANKPVESYVSYTSLGYARMLNGALQMGTLKVCPVDTVMRPTQRFSITLPNEIADALRAKAASGEYVDAEQVKL